VNEGARLQDMTATDQMPRGSFDLSEQRHQIDPLLSPPHGAAAMSDRPRTSVVAQL